MYSTVDKISFFNETHVIHRVDKREAKFTDLGGKLRKHYARNTYDLITGESINRIDR